MRFISKAIPVIGALAMAFSASVLRAEEKPATGKPATGKPAAPATTEVKVIELKAKVPDSFVEKSLGEGNGSVRVPADWKPGNLNGDTKVKVNAPGDTANINVQVKKLTNKAVTIDLLHKVLPRAVGGGFKNFELVSNDIVQTPSGIKLVRMVFDAELANMTMRFSSFIALSDTNQYTFTYGALKDKHADFAEVAEQVVVSTKLK